MIRPRPRNWGLSMNVRIVDRKKNAVVAQYEVNLGAFNYKPKPQEYYDDAWRCAVEDRLVKADERDKYTFEIDDADKRVR